MANKPELKLIQARITEKQSKKLDKAQKTLGILSRSELLRQIVSGYLEELDRKEKN